MFSLQDHLEFRLHLRYELLLLGIQPLIEDLKTRFDDEDLSKHVEFFQLVRKEDEEVLASNFNTVSFND